MELSLPSTVDRFPLHKRRLEAACHAGMKEPSVSGMLIGGSFASGEADECSDLDMQLVVKDGRVDDLVPKLRGMADVAGPVVAAFSAEHVGLPHMLIVLYEDLVHADFEPVAVSALGQRNVGLRTHILWEGNGTVSAALPAEYREDPADTLR